MSQRETMGSTQHLHTTVSPATHPIWKRLARLAASRFAVPLLFIAAFLPRVVGFVGSTSIWQARAKAFMEALATRDWAATLQAPHPGVTTMWLAGLGRQAGLILWSDFDTLPLAQQSAIELIPIALVISLGIVLAFYLVAQVFDRQVALVAALLIALDPYHISLSKAVHVDALVSIFSMLSALYLWAFIQDQSWHRVLLSGVFAGLGLLTKTPAIFLIPYFFLCLLVWQVGPWPRRRQASPALDTGSRLPRRLRQVGVAVLIWTLALALTYILLWPTMWTQPLATFGVTFGGSLYYRDTPHENPTFFLGEATSTDPGPLFYPINTAIKTTAISLVGFLLSFPLLFRRRLERHQRPALVLGIAFVLFYTVQMSLGEKKFARYALPALQFITILASVAWVYWLRRWTRPKPGPRRRRAPQQRRPPRRRHWDTPRKPRNATVRSRPNVNSGWTPWHSASASSRPPANASANSATPNWAPVPVKWSTGRHVAPATPAARAESSPTPIFPSTPRIGAAARTSRPRFKAGRCATRSC